MKFLKMLPKSRNELITGQVFFRRISCTTTIDNSDRDLFSVVGNIAVPKKLFETETQYAVAGYDSEEAGGILLGIDLKDSKKFKETFHGLSMGQLLKEAIWRI